MPQFLLQVAYTPEACATLVKNPQNRMDAIRPAVERLGGKIGGAWLSFGEYDVIVIAEFPDNVSAAALSIAAQAGGALKAAKTTPLLTTEEGVEAFRKAATSGYQPPR
jgi:uncharacterized protein with GYD domain